ncbi:peroxiredoxin [Desulfonatronum thiodismutans]|uniref:peroxiredoxin n=1 Tax=Desulfonatronum thiodismutans TaxID=159290 RepID=UPI000A73AF21|nr:peroxiredoxin [Desulfonatronum thiodismutans]
MRTAPAGYTTRMTLLLGLLWMLLIAGSALAGTPEGVMGKVFQSPKLKPIDSELKVRVDDPAPDFSLPAVNGDTITLSDYRGNKNVMLSFVPAAWTPVCSDQWPGYNILQDIFDRHETIILGITVDNIPTLHSWLQAMGGLWFPMLSDFWPHGRVADAYGLLRGDGTTERALVFIDKQGLIRFLHVEDINIRPPLEIVMQGLQNLTD